MNNIQSANKRIRECGTVADCLKLDKSLARLYDAGQFTAKEYGKLDASLMHKMTLLQLDNKYC